MMILETIKDIADAIDKIFPVNFFVVTQSGKIRWANERMLKCSGVSELKEMKGKDARIFGEDEWVHSHSVMISNKSAIFLESAQNKDFLTIKIPCAQGGFRGLAGLSIDITALKQAEQAKKDFLMNMAHDLRTPFTGIYAFAEMLYEEAQDKKVKKYLSYVVASAKQWMAVVNNIFEIMNSETLSYGDSHFDIKELILEIQELYVAAARTKGLTLNVLCERQLIYSQRLRLKQILINLVSNAIKFTKQGNVSISAIVIDKLLTFQVIDTGMGIPEDKYEYIFEKFTKLKASYQDSLFRGTGLGLYIAKQYIEKLKGEIQLSSQMGRGSTFQVEIPLDGEKLTRHAC